MKSIRIALPFLLLLAFVTLTPVLMIGQTCEADAGGGCLRENLPCSPPKGGKCTTGKKGQVLVCACLVPPAPKGTGSGGGGRGGGMIAIAVFLAMAGGSYAVTTRRRRRVDQDTGA